jgi:hypothetical protein
VKIDEIEVTERPEGKEPDFECDICDKVYISKNELDKHYQKSHEGLRYKCAICPKYFTEKNNCQNHILNEHRGQDNIIIKEIRIDVSQE